jgi:RNA polymerase sigma-70 factor (ECF subfamily)
MDPADQQDVAASLRGDGRAYERLVRRHQQQIAARMWRFTRDRTDLEELVHDVFVEAYTGLGGYKGRGPFAHWLNRIATRVGYRFWKRRKRQARQTVPLRDWDGPAPAAGAGPLETAQAGQLVHELLDRLGPRDRLVLTLMYLEEMTVNEIAEQVGWSATMVKVQAYRARKKLRALLDATGLSDLFRSGERAS